MSVCVYEMLPVHSLYAVMRFNNQSSAMIRLLHLVELPQMCTANLDCKPVLCDVLQACQSITSAMQI